MELEIVTVGENGVTEEDVLVHDETNKMMAHLAAMKSPAFPTAIGVLYCDPAPTYEQLCENSASEKEKAQYGSECVAPPGINLDG